MPITGDGVQSRALFCLPSNGEHARLGIGGADIEEDYFRALQTSTMQHRQERCVADSRSGWSLPGLYRTSFAICLRKASGLVATFRVNCWEICHPTFFLGRQVPQPPRFFLYAS